MEKIEHTTVHTNGINMHVASIGTGPVVLFLHGFPKLCVIAPDLRGYGDKNVPPSASSYTMFHTVGDLVGLVGKLGIEQVFLVGHDWGAMVAWYFCMLIPDRVKALVNTSVAFHPRNPARKPVDGFMALFGDDHYICRFQKLLIMFNTPKAPCIPKKPGFTGLPDPSTLPSWLSEEDINYYAAKFTQKGFTGGLNYYRCMNLTWELAAPWTGVQIKVPVKFIVGDLVPCV
ncbi:hypothetical protein Dsin_025450 [Dipteronia sinensis]|uniref:AB hydrolase-1 domain-containing protein n=1 Tax=Dipteronia sinensis TaxID=43782 RepID=A0AAD9ZW55_9ROSI|nr:hypothetical protein Dsin_025450 [Dipteronia sinensis]